MSRAERTRRVGPGAGEQGFSLVEILVAFTLMAVGLGGLYQALGVGLQSAELADQYSRASMVARTQLARAGVDFEVAEGEVSDRTEDGFAWRVQVQPYVPAEGELPLGEDGPEPVVVRVEVSWEAGVRTRTLTLTSVRLKVPLR